MQDNDAEFRELVQSFSDRHALAFETRTEPGVDALVVFPHTAGGLSFDLVICLQNEHVTLEFGGFRGFFATGGANWNDLADRLDQIVTGACRVRVHHQFGRVHKRVLEHRDDTVWRPVYTHYSAIRLPFVPDRISYLSNAPEQ
ncbi:MAG: hypothetical protein AAGA28_18080 [Pseudomonadota bacterium]